MTLRASRRRWLWRVWLFVLLVPGPMVFPLVELLYDHAHGTGDVLFTVCLVALGVFLVAMPWSEDDGGPATPQRAGPPR